MEIGRAVDHGSSGVLEGDSLDPGGDIAARISTGIGPADDDGAPVGYRAIAKMAFGDWTAVIGRGDLVQIGRRSFLGA